MVGVPVLPRIWWVTAVLTATGTQLFAQVGIPTQLGPHIMGYGYTLPVPVKVAPGQLITLIIDATTLPLGGTFGAPTGSDLPNTLDGVSIRYFQLGNATTTTQAPILAVQTFYGCSVPNPQLNTARGECVPLGAVTVQIPFEARACYYSCAALISHQDGEVDLAVASFVFDDQLHVLTSCDTVAPSYTEAPGSATGLPCASIVTHADGSLVSAKDPANGGEEIVAWAVGLGQTNPPLQTGKLVTAAVPTQTTFGLDFNYRPNALASKPLPDAQAPVFAGATPGYVGLYQINFVVPPPPAGTPPCVEPSQSGQNVVYSNLTVSVGGQSSFDGARICVAVPNS